jgi:hypothetical protein
VDCTRRPLHSKCSWICCLKDGRELSFRLL